MSVKKEDSGPLGLNITNFKAAREMFMKEYEVLPQKLTVFGGVMTNEEILRKAIEKALKGGLPKAEFFVTINGKKDIEETIHYYSTAGKSYYALIFSHSFAKAFWGEGKYCGPDSDVNPWLPPENWKYHLQKMVLFDEPLKYLEQFLTTPKEKG